MKPKLTKKQRELWEKVKEQILADPQRFNMLKVLYKSEEGCGTVGCIAGWAWLINEGKGVSDELPKIKGAVIMARSAPLLGLDGTAQFTLETERQDEAGRMFFSCHWPKRFHEALDNVVISPETPTRKAIRRRKAEIAVDRINHWLETGE